MQSLEKRIAVLETAQANHGLFSVPELNALMDDIWAKHGTSHVEQVARYGSEHALLKALRADIQSIHARPLQMVNKHDNN